MWHEPDSPHAEFSATLELDLSRVQPSLAGPKRPQDRVLLSDMKANFHENVGGMTKGRKTKVGCAVHERSEEHTSELQSLMRISYAVFCLKKKKNPTTSTHKYTPK